MLRKKESQQLSFYSALYDKIPEKHILKKIDKAVVLGAIKIWRIIINKGGQ